jgi:hypothetical protein
MNFVGAAAVALAPFAPPSSGRAETLAQDGVEWFTDVPVTIHDGQTTLRLCYDVMKGKNPSLEICLRRFAQKRLSGGAVCRAGSRGVAATFLTTGAMTSGTIVNSMIGAALEIGGP